MTQTTFLLTSKAPSQADRILGALEARRGEWVGMTELYSVSRAFAVHSRVADLRKRGHSIDNAERLAPAPNHQRELNT